MEVVRLFVDRLKTPIGEMLIVADRDGCLCATDWLDHEPRMERWLSLHYGSKLVRLEPSHNPHGVTNAISRYFAGDVEVIDSLPVATRGTPFQQTVWQALRKIPCGTTLSYQQLAEQIGRPNAVRAVGLANGSNPVGIVVPCHRVIGSNGSLTGYGGGLKRKRWLLDHEQQMSNEGLGQKHLPFSGTLDP